MCTPAPQAQGSPTAHRPTGWSVLAPTVLRPRGFRASRQGVLAGTGGFVQPLAFAPRLFEVGRSSVWGIDSEQWGDTHACNGHQQLSRVAFDSARVPSRNQGHLGSRRRPTWEVRMCTASQGFISWPQQAGIAHLDRGGQRPHVQEPSSPRPARTTIDVASEHARGMRTLAAYVKSQEKRDKPREAKPKTKTHI